MDRQGCRSCNRSPHKPRLYENQRDSQRRRGSHFCKPRQLCNQRKPTATFAGGCFWCTEAVFKRLKGVESVVSGYAGSQVENPTYQRVSSGSTGAAEAIQLKFDPKRISYEKLLEIFWATHDPTTLNRQGADSGTQYRSSIFYQNETQKQAAEKSKEEMDRSGKMPSTIVTEIIPLKNFSKAEDYHQNYYELNKNSNPYCSIVIDPKIEKLIHLFNDQIKEEYK
ncbi:peptide-methionine (S)-S-oxide reductase MsrA [Candidatus Curtissbacteria bacterium]|nr:peptide-methionine (S)-S-oxide reductase MsrA [Candidatus Curtissbacteria bacterium]